MSHRDLYGHPKGLSGALAPLPGIDEDKDKDNNWLHMIKSRVAQYMALALPSWGSLTCLVW